MIVAASLLVGAALAAAPAVPDQPRFPATLRLLAGQVRSLSRPVLTYHYATRARFRLPEGAAVAPAYPLLQQGFAARIERYWDLSAPVRPMANASGLYLASDPVISRTFGGIGEGWALVQVRLRAGFRFIDAREHTDGQVLGQVFPIDVQRELRAVGCPARLPGALLVAAEVQGCREAAVEVLRALDVDGILYSFAAYPFHECTPRVDGGFILLRPQAIRAEDVRLLTVDSVRLAEAAPERDVVHRMFLRARAAGSARDTPWPELPPVADLPSFARWMREHVFGCGTYAEDALQTPAISAGLMRAWQAVADRMESADARFAFARALLEEDARHRPRALQELQTALDLEPDHVPSLESLAWQLSTTPEATSRDGVRAKVLAERLVELTHYRDRVATTGRSWSRAYRIRASHVLTAAAAAAGDFPRAVDYAQQASEAAQQLAHEREGALTTWLAEQSRRFLDTVSAGRPIVQTPDERLPDIPYDSGALPSTRPH